MKRIYKFGTGQEIPEGAVYLTTIVADEIISDAPFPEKVRLVWHYFLVEDLGNELA